MKSFHVAVDFGTDEIAALKAARDHVRLYMAQEHLWTVRDAALEALNKMIAAALPTGNRRLSSAVDLSGEEIEALRQAHGHVRVHMAHKHTWVVRDFAMQAIGKMVAAAQELPSAPTETDRLVAEMEALPKYRGWQFSYEYPGYFCFSHPDAIFRVFFTPDWDGAETLPIEVQDTDGQCYTEHADRLPLPRDGRTAQKIFNLVRATLDKLLGAATSTGGCP